MVHRSEKLRGFHLLATDGVIGHVDEFLFDEQTWTIRYLVVDTSNWIGGRTVLVSTDVVTRIAPVEQEIHVSISRAAVKGGPSMDSADIPLAERLPAIWIM